MRCRLSMVGFPLRVCDRADLSLTDASFLPELLLRKAPRDPRTSVSRAASRSRGLYSISSSFPASSVWPSAASTTSNTRRAEAMRMARPDSSR